MPHGLQSQQILPGQIDPQMLFPPTQQPRERHLAGPPLKVSRNADVYPTLGDALETSIANKGEIVLYTGNFRQSGYSNGYGKTFKPIDQTANVFGMIAKQAPCCDQVVQYVPSIDRFVWVTLYVSAGNPMRIAEISPDDLLSGKGKTGWRVWTLNVTDFPAAPSGDAFDYPDLEVGRKYLYLTVNIVPGNHPIVARLSLAKIKAGADPIIADYVYLTDMQHARVAQVPQNRQRGTAYFAGLPDDTHLRIYRWNEAASSPSPATNVPIRLINQYYHWPTPDKPALPPPKGCPYSNDLYACGNAKFDDRPTGATLAGANLWFAWSEGGDPADQNSPPYLRAPHISIEIVNASTLTPVTEEVFADGIYANGHPNLATNGSGDVGITWAWGGGKYWGNTAVGFIDPPPALTGSFSYTGFGTSGGLPGHYISIREFYPDTEGFLLAGNYVQLKGQNHPHVVIFRR